MEIWLIILAHAFMSISFWDHNFTIALYLINRLPNIAFPDYNSSFQPLFNKQPEYDTIKTFGYACFPLLRSYNKNKLQFRSAQRTYLGVSITNKGQKCLNLEGRIFISKDDIFNKTQFPSRASYLKLDGLSHTQLGQSPQTSYLMLLQLSLSFIHM